MNSDTVIIEVDFVVPNGKGCLAYMNPVTQVIWNGIIHTCKNNHTMSPAAGVVTYFNSIPKVVTGELVSEHLLKTK